MEQELDCRYSYQQAVVRCSVSGDPCHVLHCHRGLDSDGGVLHAKRWLHREQNSAWGQRRPVPADFNGFNLTLCPKAATTLWAPAVRPHKLLRHLPHFLSSVQQTWGNSFGWTREEQYDLFPWFWARLVQRQELGYGTGNHSLGGVHLIFVSDIHNQIEFRCSARTLWGSWAGGRSMLFLLWPWWRWRWRTGECEGGNFGHLWREAKHCLQLLSLPFCVLFGFSLCDDDYHQLVRLWTCQHRKCLQRELVYLLGQDGLLLGVCIVVPVADGGTTLLPHSSVPGLIIDTIFLTQQDLLEPGPSDWCFSPPSWITFRRHLKLAFSFWNLKRN